MPSGSEQENAGMRERASLPSRIPTFPSRAQPSRPQAVESSRRSGSRRRRAALARQCQLAYRRRNRLATPVRLDGDGEVSQ